MTGCRLSFSLSLAMSYRWVAGTFQILSGQPSPQSSKPASRYSDCWCRRRSCSVVSESGLTDCNGYSSRCMVDQPEVSLLFNSSHCCLEFTCSRWGYEGRLDGGLKNFDCSTGSSPGFAGRLKSSDAGVSYYMLTGILPIIFLLQVLKRFGNLIEESNCFIKLYNLIFLYYYNSSSFVIIIFFL